MPLCGDLCIDLCDYVYGNLYIYIDLYGDLCTNLCADHYDHGAASLGRPRLFDLGFIQTRRSPRPPHDAPHDAALQVDPGHRVPRGALHADHDSHGAALQAAHGPYANRTKC
jgi:hypothetical protein